MSSFAVRRRASAPFALPVSAGRRIRQGGSALLIVFVFAAIIAILLYRELPVVLFEAKRQKEQLLMDRGHEYVRAIQLFYRRNRGQYPASIDQLENTNNIRYLRRRYVDPFTGKDDWRLLHAGPGGILIDSKVNRGLPGTPGSTGTPGSGTGTGSFGQSTSFPSSGGQNAFGQNSPGQSGFAQSSFSGNSSSSSSEAEVVVPDVPQRGPAMPAAGAGQVGMPSSADLAQNPEMPLLPPANDGSSTSPAGTGGTSPSAPPASAPGMNAQDGSGRAGQSNPMQLMNPMLTSPSGTNPQTQGGGAFASSSGSFGQSSSGQMLGGGALAGIASKATGHSIKAVEDQRDYAKWEFYYDPSKDRGIGGSQQVSAPSSGGFGQNGSTGSPGVATQPTQAFQSTPTQPAPNAPPPDPGVQPQ